MPSLMENALALGIIIFVGLMIWSKVQHQKMADTLKEIKEMVAPKEVDG